MIYIGIYRGKNGSIIRQTEDAFAVRNGEIAEVEE